MHFQKRRFGNDMTSMVDVVFLLLIFFMVTATFSFQLAQPQAAKNDQPSPVATETDASDFIQVAVLPTNSYSVTIDDFESEASTLRELRTQIRQAKFNSGADNLRVLAHVDARHQQVVAALDVADSVGMNKTVIQTTDEDL